MKPIVSEAKTNPNVAQSRPGPPPVRGQPSNSEQLKARGASSSDSQRGIPSVISKTNTQKTALHLSSTAKASTAASVSVTKPPVSTSHQLTGYPRTTSLVTKTSSGSSESSSSSTSSLSSTKSDSQRLPASRAPTNQSGSQTYSKEEIERKKQEALKRRQNRLKLSGKKTWSQQAVIQKSAMVLYRDRCSVVEKSQNIDPCLTCLVEPNSLLNYCLPKSSNEHKLWFTWV